MLQTTSYSKVETHVKKGSLGVQNESPQEVSLWYANYLELKETKTLWAQENLLS